MAAGGVGAYQAPYILGGVGSFSSSVTAVTGSFYNIIDSNETSKRASWGYYYYPTGVSAYGTTYVYVETTDGRSAAVASNLVLSITNDGSYLTVMKGS
jgi:hypothetical protein